MKNFLTGILVSSMLLGAMTVSAAVEIEENPYIDASVSHSETLSSGSCGENATYAFDKSTGTLTISGTGAMEDYGNVLDLPWFDYGDDIKSIVISEGITSLYNATFNPCTSLASVSFPSSIESIWLYAFDYAPTLLSISVGADNPSYTTVDGVLFDKNQTELLCYPSMKTETSYEIPSSVTKIRDSAFMANTYLTSVSIPNSVTTIGEWSFSECSSLTSIDIPSSVTSIGTGAFSTCTSLTSIDIPNSLTSIVDSLFSECTSLTNVNIPSSVTSIEAWAFQNCTSLSEITIPSSVTNIEGGVFYQCTSLNNVTIPNSVTNLGGEVFAYCSSLTDISLPSSITSIKTGTFQHCISLSSITLPSSVTSIEWSAFKGCTDLSDITIPNAVTTIGEWVFEDCISLSTITIPNSVTTIDIQAFGGCTSLSDITIPSSVTSISNNAFLSCTSLASITVDSDNQHYASENGCLFNKDKTTLIICPAGITATSYTIPSSVTSIGGGAFLNCTNLNSITIPSSVTSMGPMTFSGCSSLGSITIPSTVTSIDNWVFDNCTSLTTVTIPNSVTDINTNAFRGCTSLASISIPSSVTSISEDAFISCTSLTSITVDSNNETYTSENGCLFNKDKTTLIVYPSGIKATSYTVPSSVNNIGHFVFHYNTNLYTINIPSSVTSIGNWTFNSCDNLSDVYYSGSSEDWSNVNVSLWNDSLKSATMHYNATLQDTPTTPTAPTTIFSSWATSHIEKAQENDLIVNSLGTDYTSNITRSQIADLLVNMVEKYTGTTLTSADSSTFTDTTDTAILKANAAGIISGMGDGTFAPNSTATREQIAMMIYKTILVMEDGTSTEIVTKNTTLGQYNDSSDVSDWALEAVAILANNGIMEGTGEGNLSPLATASIEQGIILNNALFDLN